MGGARGVDERHEVAGPGDARAADGDAWDPTGGTAAMTGAAHTAAGAPDTDEAVALVAASARDYAGQAKAANTLRAYRADWADFAAWCDRYALPPLPAAPETVALTPRLMKFDTFGSPR